MWCKGSQTYKTRLRSPMKNASINSPRCGTSDCKNLIQITAVKYEGKNHQKSPEISSSAATQTVDTDQTSAVEEVNPLMAIVSTVPYFC